MFVSALMMFAHPIPVTAAAVHSQNTPSPSLQCTVNNKDTLRIRHQTLNHRDTLNTFRIVQCYICKVSLLFTALYAKCPYYAVLYKDTLLIIKHLLYYILVLYMQSVLIIYCCTCKVSLLYAKCSYCITALNAKCPYYLVLYKQSVLMIHCFTCKVSLLCSALHAKCPYYAVLCMQSVLII